MSAGNRGRLCPSLASAMERAVAASALTLAMCLAPGNGWAQHAERTGKETVDTLCMSCHGSGANGAPRIGDKKAWEKRAAQGLTGLTANALKGIRQMPPHGGNTNLTDTAVERAITYMVNQSGGNWIEPTSRTTRTAERTGEQVVQARCIKCHGTGEGGAPKIGDRAAWIPRVKQGLDVVIRSAINGHGAMPARGGQADLTDTEMRNAVIYMFNKGTAPTVRASATATAPRADGTHKVVAGIAFELGVVSAETLRAQHPTPDAESTMHGGIPTAKGHYHVNISLHDAATNAEIRDAEVKTSITNPVTGTETKALEPMSIGDTLTYGNYFRMPGREPYTIVVRVLRPNVAQAIEARFVFRHD